MKKNGRTKFGLVIFLILAFVSSIAAQEVFRVSDTVQTPDGKTGKVESFKNEEMAKVRFGSGANDARFFMLTDLKKVKLPNSAPTETFRVGDMVESPRFPPGKIVAINGNSATIRYGNGKYDVGNALLQDLISPQAAAAKREREKTEKLDRAGFEEAQPFLQVVKSLAIAYNPKFQEGNFASDAATYEKWRKELDALYAVCQKYPNLANRPDVNEDDISQNVADWCGMAKDRTAVLKRMKALVIGFDAKTESDIWRVKIEEALRDPRGDVRDDLQMLLYDRAAWEEKNMQSVKKKFAAGELMPSDLFASLDEKIAELKAKIETGAATFKWETPPYSDATLEAMIKKAFPAQYPGAKVFKTGMNFTTWKAVDDTSLVGSGTGYKVYRTTKGAYRYKLGLALVKLPNQPLCQIREFEFTQDKAGAGYSATKLSRPLGYTGISVNCP